MSSNPALCVIQHPCFLCFTCQPHRASIVYRYPQTTEQLFTLAWKDQPRLNGRFIPRPRADTITPHDTESLSYSRTTSPYPTSESSLTPSSELLLTEDASEYSLIDYTYPRLPPPPTNSPAPPSPKQKTSPLRMMQLENIPEFSGTQEDNVQPSDFLKAVKCSFLASRATTDDQKVSIFELYI